MKSQITLKKKVPIEELAQMLKKIEFRGLYNDKGEKIKPYKKAKFSLAKVYPASELGGYPTIRTQVGKSVLFSPQPTIYQNQIKVIEEVHSFLKGQGMGVNKLDGAIEYDWEGRGAFHMIPPIVERHVYDLKDGLIHLDALTRSFSKFYVKDSQNNLHSVAERYLRDFYIDEVSSIKHLDIFHSNTPLINYGLQFSGKKDFHIVCDGMHRIDYAIEYLQEPITVILVEPETRPLIPYYAFPVPFFPTIRLSSKESEKIYPRLERDKIHLFNDFLKKVLHYDWTPAGLKVSKLRSNAEIF